MLGRFDEAHALLATTSEKAAVRSGSRAKRALAWIRFDIARLEGRWAEAEAAAREGADSAEADGELLNYLYSTMVAQALVELDQTDEAAACLDRAEAVAPNPEPEPQVRSRFVRARVLATAGAFGDAERLARESVALADETDQIDLRGEAHLELATVLSLAGADARPELEQALALFERKGNLVMARRMRARLG